MNLSNLSIQFIFLLNIIELQIRVIKSLTDKKILLQFLSILTVLDPAEKFSWILLGSRSKFWPRSGQIRILPQPYLLDQIAN